ncbi:excinuclease ABC subunit UvrC [Klebsiella pneumoniae]
MQESIQLVIDSAPFLLKGAVFTLQLSIGGMFFGLVLGFILALMRMSPVWPVKWLARMYISIFRGTPLIAQLFMIYYGLPQFGIELDPIPAAMIGLSLNTAAYAAETLRAAIASIDKGQWEAAASIGMTPWQTMRRAILPQAARVALPLLQKIFPIRQCENSVYRNRSRPCLQYQIGRCLGPCVAGLVSEEEYAQQVEYVRLFLAGKDDQVLTQLIARMEKASQNLEFEEAARIRDQIQAVRRVTEKQFVSNTGDDLDVIGVAFDAGMACVHVLFIRQGKVLGSRSYFPKVPGGTELGEVVETFVGQFYLQGSQMRTLPGEILLDFNLGDKTLLADSLSELAGRRINVQTKPRGDRARYLKLARTNAATALTTKLSQQSTIHQRLQALASVLELPAVKRMECFDISHTMGEQTVASCVVFDSNGPLRAEYRRYNITGITPGDDYAAMNQVLRRRYGKAINDNKIPDVILIDGGKGQLAQAKAVFAELDVPWDKHHPLLLGVAKGSDRKAGLETLFFEPEGEGFSLPPDSPALHVIQHIRDESHDHAISGHRKKRAKVKSTSSLETIEGVGPKRRQMLLKYMGGLQGLQQASVEEIAKVPGISHALAEKIFYSLKH